MAANTNAIFPLTPKVSWAKAITGNTAVDGTGTSVTCFTAGANGSRVDMAVVQPIGTNTASVLRLYVNNGSTAGTATNNSCIFELALPAVTISQTANGLYQLTVPLNLVLPAGYTILATVGTTMAAGVQVTVFGGDY